MPRELMCWSCLHVFSIPDNFQEGWLICPKCQANVHLVSGSATDKMSTKTKETPLHERKVSQLTAAGWVLILFVLGIMAASGFWLADPCWAIEVVLLVGLASFAIGAGVLKMFGIGVFKEDKRTTPASY